MKFTPSAGVGGHCIPVDPSYLAHLALENGVRATFIERANEVNLEMPAYIAKRVASDNGGSLKGKKVLVVGGGEGATVREVLRWDASAVASVDWVDIDGDLVELCQQHLGWADDSVRTDSRLMFCPDDINSFLDRTPGVYDAIILDLPDPDVEMLDMATDLSDTLYGPRFRERIMSHLSLGGGIVTHCGPIRPGADTVACGMGMVWIKEQLFKGIEVFPYHVCIPSFQGEWGFMMTKAPTVSPLFPAGLRVMDRTVAGLAFTWPKYWTTL
jgi:spermidine synthase